MKAKILFSADETTTEMFVEGHRISSQLFPDGRGIVTVRDEGNNLVQTIQFSRVYLIDKSH